MSYHILYGKLLLASEKVSEYVYEYINTSVWQCLQNLGKKLGHNENYGFRIILN